MAATPVLNDSRTTFRLSTRRAASRTATPPLIPTFILAALCLTALLAPLLTPYSPVEGVLRDRLMPPAWEEGGHVRHLLGADALGRDVLSRVIYGSRISLLVSLISIFLSGGIGTAIGIVSGYFGGWVDTLLMRLTDVSLSLPGVLIAILLAAARGSAFENVIIVVVLILWSRYARQVRGETLAIKEREFVALARVAGCSNLTVMVRHIFPNLVPTLLVLASLQIGYVILLESSLSFLGVGIPPPQPSWGSMVNDGKAMLERAWWISLFPGLAIMLTIVSLNVLGDWMRDRLDPRLRQL